MTTLLAISIGNTRTQVGRFDGAELVSSSRHPNDDPAALLQRIIDAWNESADRSEAVVAIASVNEPVSSRLASMIEDQLSIDVYVVGRDLPVPLVTSLDPETITGMDRLLNAAAGYGRLQQACIVVDAGTAVTVDFVDGEGTFHGGAIAPGARMQLHALHRETTALPEIDFRRPDDDETFGRSTGEAMIRGVYHGIRGLVRRLVEEYSTRYGAFPLVIATGGDAEALFTDDEIVDRIVPDLTLYGIAACVEHALAARPDEDGDTSG